jgi:MTH538 TIR-like domain (DUF1863)
MALYDAFISYSHAKDKPIAAALQSATQKLGKPWYRRRALRLFRDDTSLSATPHLWPMIEQALGQSRHFLLIASPEAAGSKWVDKEVTYWLEHNSIDTVLIGLTDGELSWDESAGDFVGTKGQGVPLPPALTKRFADEPKWVDLRPYREGAAKAASMRDAKFTELAANFAAAIHGMPKEDLLSQEVRQQRRAFRQAFSAAVLLLAFAAIATAAGVKAYLAQKEAIRQQNRAERRYDLAVDASIDLMIALATVQKTREAQESRNSPTFYSILMGDKSTSIIFRRLLDVTPDRHSLDCRKARRLIYLANTSTTSRLSETILSSFGPPSNEAEIVGEWTDAASTLQRNARCPAAKGESPAPGE